MTLTTDPSPQRENEADWDKERLHAAFEGLMHSFSRSAFLPPVFSDAVKEDPFVCREGRPFIAHMFEVLEYYKRGPEDFDRAINSDVMVGTIDLDHGFTLRVGDQGFSIVLRDQDGHQSLRKEVTFRDATEDVSHRLQSFSDTILPHTILHTGPSRYLLSIYGPTYHATHIYGLKTSESNVQLEFLYRIQHFGERLASAPFLVPGGPASVYQDTIGKVHAYWFLQESNDVEKIFESEEPLQGALINPRMDRDGNLRFTCGDTSYAHEVFYEDYWLTHLERVGLISTNR